MPELPDIAAYIEALADRIPGQTLERIAIRSPFLLRTAQPPIAAAEGRIVVNLRRLGKRIAIGLEDDVWLVLHLMIAGRLHWIDPAAAARRNALAEFVFSNGTLTLTEAGSKRRASLYLVVGEAALLSLDAGGIDVLTCTLREFQSALTAENHTLKRALTDPGILSGIGNAYSDEILHAARLSPLAQTKRLSDAQWEALFAAAQSTLELWIEKLREQAGHAFPEGVTAFRGDMAAHGRFGKPCPRCGEKIRRIRYADGETNYCARCQTGGKILSDRVLSRLLNTSH